MMMVTTRMAVTAVVIVVVRGTRSGRFWRAVRVPVRVRSTGPVMVVIVHHQSLSGRSTAMLRFSKT
jgi:hypothetical protein